MVTQITTTKTKTTRPARPVRSQPRASRIPRPIRGTARVLTRQNGVTGQGRDYIKCVLSSEGGAQQIPDGSNSHSVAIEYKTSATLGPDSTGNLHVACVPGLPGALRIMAGAGTVYDRENIPVTLVDFRTVGGVTLPFTDFCTASPVMNQQTQIQAARLVSYKMCVTQIGPVLNQSGVAACVKWKPKMTGERSSAVFTGGLNIRGEVIDPATCAMVRTGLEDVLDIDFQSALALPGSMERSATKPCTLLGVPIEREFTQVAPLYRSSTYAPGNAQPNNDYNDTTLWQIGLNVGSWHNAASTDIAFGVSNQWTYGHAGNAGNVIFPIIPRPGDKSLYGDFWSANEECLAWIGKGLTAGTQFEVRVTMCVEMLIQPSYSHYRPLVRPPPPEDDRAIQAVARVAKEAPVAIEEAPGATGWWAALASTTQGIADIVSGLGIPVLSQAASMGQRLAKMLI